MHKIGTKIQWKFEITVCLGDMWESLCAEAQNEQAENHG